MCNLSQGIAEKGIEQDIRQMVVNMYNSDMLTILNIADVARMSVEDI